MFSVELVSITGPWSPVTNKPSHVRRRGSRWVGSTENVLQSAAERDRGGRELEGGRLSKLDRLPVLRPTDQWVVWNRDWLATDARDERKTGCRGWWNLHGRGAGGGESAVRGLRSVVWCRGTKGGGQAAGLAAKREGPTATGGFTRAIGAFPFGEGYEIGLILRLNFGKLSSWTAFFSLGFSSPEIVLTINDKKSFYLSWCSDRFARLGICFYITDFVCFIRIVRLTFLSRKDLF